MVRKTTGIFLFLIFLQCSGIAQPGVKIQTGFGYIEHFSAGVTLTFAEKHNLSILYGSDFFMNPKDFMNILLQYNYKLKRFNFAGITPGIGVKGGYSVYSNKYYRWKLSEVVPFARLSYDLNNRFDLFLDAGMTLSIEHSVERISFGEIGMYRKYLPEFKLGINFWL